MYVPLTVQKQYLVSTPELTTINSSDLQLLQEENQHGPIDPFQQPSRSCRPIRESFKHRMGRFYTAIAVTAWAAALLTAKCRQPL